MAAVIVFIIEIVQMRFYKKATDVSRKQLALGVVVNAKRIKVWDDDITGMSVDSWVYATYVYEVDDQTYQYKYMDRASAPLIMKIYYTDSPCRAFLGKEK